MKYILNESLFEDADGQMTIFDIINNEPIKLSVVYKEFSNQGLGAIKNAKVQGKSLKDALLNAVDQLSLGLDSEKLEDLETEEIIEILKNPVSTADNIVELTDETNNRLIFKLPT